jgi:2-dehydropantoate 2-reductase
LGALYEALYQFGEVSSLWLRWLRVCHCGLPQGPALCAQTPEPPTPQRQPLVEKFLFITDVEGVTALARSGIGPLLASAEGQRLLTASCAEVEAVARAEGIQLGSDAVDRIFKQATSLAPQWQSSMARDLEVGRRLEVEALSGAVVRRGRTYDIATPVHQAIWDCLSAHQP